MTYNEVVLNSIRKYRNTHRDKINELHKGYAKIYYYNNRELYSKKKLDYYHWKKENTFEGIIKTFNKILIKDF